ncbi:MAG TPA: hypothetical protein ENK43_07560 [Planctomycetes bacterium]|nr:hypothetical protein [Planctomycetota bacterium]
MPRTLCAFACAWILGFVAAPRVRAHGDLHKKIAAASREIAKHPNNPDLYARRGELYRLHREFERALADLSRAESLAPDREAFWALRASVLHALKRDREAQGEIARFLGRQPNHGEALWLSAEIEAALGNWNEAARGYAAAVIHLRRRTPRHYVTWAEAVLKTGAGSARRAIEILDAGRLALAGAWSLEIEALRIERSHRLWDAALRRVDRILRRAPRKESWLLEKGRILEAAGRTSEARSAYEAASAALEKLPRRVLRLPATKSLEQRIRKALRRIGPKS